jgi:putative DNA primase/helicase
MHLNDLLSRLRSVKSSGDGHTARCPAHDDAENSLSIGRGEDGRLLLNCHAGCEPGAIVAAMGITYRDLFPPESKPQNGKPQITAVWPYTDENGKTLYEKMRRDPGKKFSHRVPTADGGYTYKMEGVRRVLFRLDKLHASPPTRFVFLVEGEKDAETLEKHGLLATTNSCGAKAWRAEYTEQLKKFSTVIILIDEDAAGHARARKLKKLLPNARVIRLPGLEVRSKHGQDVTDWLELGHTIDELKALVASGVDMTPEEEAPSPAKEPAPAPKKPQSKSYRPLGYRGDHFYFLPQKTQQLVSLTAASMGMVPNLLRLAPIQHWETSFLDGDGKFSKNAAVDYLIREAHEVGVFDIDLVRGRGAWRDGDNIVYHKGDCLIVDGTVTALGDLPTNYVYERGSTVEIQPAAYVPSDERANFMRLCNLFAWQSPESSKLLAGWTVLSPVCGVLDWRPHILITAPTGAGKSWILSDVLSKFDQTSLCVQGATTEPGLRQALGRNAISVLFDEAEPDDFGANRIQKILELARQASSKGDFKVYKGTPGGQALSYDICAMFCLASIGADLRKKADKNRFCILELKAAPGGPHFKKVAELAHATITPAFTSGMVARSVRLAREIMESAKTYCEAFTAELGSRRLGDQIGTLMAGWWHLENDIPVSPEKAEEHAQEFILDGVISENEMGDEARCLQHILEYRTVIDLGLDRPHRIEQSVGELLELAAPRVSVNGTTAAREALERMGIKAEEDAIYVSTSHSAIAKMMAGTPWPHGWSAQLRRLEGADSPRKVVRFAGSVSKSTLIPWSIVLGEPEKVEAQSEIPF